MPVQLTRFACGSVVPRAKVADEPVERAADTSSTKEETGDASAWEDRGGTREQEQEQVIRA